MGGAPICGVTAYAKIVEKYVDEWFKSQRHVFGHGRRVWMEEELTHVTCVEYCCEILLVGECMERLL